MLINYESNLDKSALLVIDVQKYFFRKGAHSYLPMSEAALPNIIKLIEAYRSASKLIVFTRHVHKIGKDTGMMGKWWNNQVLWEDDPDSLLMDDIKPWQNEIVINKDKYSAFQDTGLQTILGDRNIDTVVICGAMTNVCCETSARHAFMLDFAPIIISDACATKNEQYHNASLLNLSYAFAEIKETSEIINKLSVKK